MSYLRGEVARWARTLVALGAPFGAASAILSYLLRRSLALEPSFETEIFTSGGGGPTMVLLLAWALGGYVAGALAETLGLAGVLAMIFVGTGALVALGCSMGTYALLAGGVPIVLCFADAVCAVAWLAGAAKRLCL